MCLEWESTKLISTLYLSSMKYCLWESTEALKFLGENVNWSICSYKLNEILCLNNLV